MAWIFKRPKIRRVSCPNPFSDVVEVEEPISNELRDGLRALGHGIQPASKPIGGSQAIFIDWETGLPIDWI